MKNLARKPIPAAPAPAGSLAAALAAVPDPRRPYGWRPEYPPLPLVGLLQLTVAAVLCGARSLSAVAQWGHERLADEPACLVDLGLPAGRSPCIATLHRVYKALDVAVFEAVLGAWLARSGVSPDDALAFDGKTLRGTQGEHVPGVHLVSAYAHAAGAVLGQLRSAGKGHELIAAKALLAQVPLVGRLVTADALLTQREVCTQIVARQGDYLLPVDENQPALREDIQAAFSPLGGDRRGRVRPAAVAALVAGRSRRPGRAVEREHRAGAESGAWAAGSAHVVGAGRSGAQRVRRQ
jgi:hypothetical protein